MARNATFWIDSLIKFGLAKALFFAEDEAYMRNLLLDAMGLYAPEAHDADDAPVSETAAAILDELSDIAVRRGLIEDGAEDRTRFGVRLMGLLTPAPQAVRTRFALLRARSPEAETDWFYHMQRDCDYIRVREIAQNVQFERPSPVGRLEITINLSKPEKDPRDIARALHAPKLSYPQCMLCVENPGYAGRPGFPARQNHRVVPLDLSGDVFYLQYSPYLYYEEHCIVFNKQHVKMTIDRRTFSRLFAFVGQFPHYFLGSNADLPIVGGSILSHDHFQGGRHVFPMDRAGVRVALCAPDPRVSAAVVDWPMTCIRLRCATPSPLIDAGCAMLEAWRAYDDPDLGIFARTTEPHNTVTPIVRRDGDDWILNIVLRNNRTDEAHPLGIFHPHAGLHHIKKENIGLIEVMGLFILPGRLLREMDDAARYLTGERPLSDRPAAEEPVAKHFEWINRLFERRGAARDADEARETLRSALAEICAQVLTDAGVYKPDEAGQRGLLRFLRTLGYTAK